MENRNSYFKPMVEQDSLYLEIFPAMEGGKDLDIKEVMTYLSGQGYHDYDMKQLNTAIASGAQEKVYIGRSMGKIFHEKVDISLSLDNMLVRCRFYPPSDGGRKLTREDIQDALRHEKVVYGVDEEIISKLLQSREYCTEYLIGKGTPPTMGKDAKIVYYFSTRKSLKPKHNEDGSVN